MRRTKKAGKKQVRAKQVGAVIDEELYKLAKGCAAVQGRRVGEVIDDALRAYLGERGFGSDKVEARP